MFSRSASKENSVIKFRRRNPIKLPRFGVARGRPGGQFLPRTQLYTSAGIHVSSFAGRLRRDERWGGARGRRTGRFIAPPATGYGLRPAPRRNVSLLRRRRRRRRRWMCSIGQSVASAATRRSSSAVGGRSNAAPVTPEGLSLSSFRL